MKSSFCSASGCVEITQEDDGDNILMEDSKIPNSPRIILDKEQWRGMLVAIKSGAMDV